MTETPVLTIRIREVMKAQRWSGPPDLIPGVEHNPDGEPASPYIVNTLTGPVAINPGDYVVTGIGNARFPVSEAQFNDYYEVVGAYEQGGWRPVIDKTTVSGGIGVANNRVILPASPHLPSVDMYFNADAAEQE